MNAATERSAPVRTDAGHALVERSEEMAVADPAGRPVQIEGQPARLKPVRRGLSLVAAIGCWFAALVPLGTWVWLLQGAGGVSAAALSSLLRTSQTLPRWLGDALIDMLAGGHAAAVTALALFPLCSTAAAITLLAHGLLQRGWRAGYTALACAIVLASPAALFMAVPGTPLLITLAPAALLVIAADILCKYPDSHALISFSLAIPIVLLTTKAGVPLVSVTVALVLLSLPQMRSPRSALAIFLVVTFPAALTFLHPVLRPSVIGQRETVGGFYGPNPSQLGEPLLLALIYTLPALIPLLRHLLFPAAERNRRIAVALIAILTPPVFVLAEFAGGREPEPLFVAGLALVLTLSWLCRQRGSPADIRLHLGLLVIADIAGWAAASGSFSALLDR